MIGWHPWVGRVLAAVTFAVTLAFAVGPEAADMGWPASVFVASACAVTVWLSAVRPRAALLLAAATTAALPVVRSTFGAMDLVVVLVGFQAAMHSKLPPWVVASAVFAMLTVNDVWLRSESHQSYMSPSVLYPVLLTALSVGLGLQSRRVLEQHRELIALHDADRLRAVSDERRRIARDLHDIAAHHLSALVVRNKLARRVGTTEALDRAAEFSSETAADALDALRRVVQVLSTGAAAPFDPQPSIADLDAVVRRVGEAGLAVDWQTERTAELPRDVEIAVVRIAQEALANVLQHRGPGRAWLTVAGRGDQLVVTVEDDGPTAWRPEVADPHWHRPGSHGIVGMRERAEACGGRFTVGASPLGGWRVSAELPAAWP